MHLKDSLHFTFEKNPSCLRKDITIMDVELAPEEQVYSSYPQSESDGIQSQRDFLEASGHKTKIDSFESFIKSVSEREIFETNVPVNLNQSTSLRLSNMIEENGNIPFSVFMQECLYGQDGYYSSGKVRIGGPREQHSDFVTSPEASELFGATLAKVAKEQWEVMGRPEKFDIVEMGAGRGKLAYDFLKWLKNNEPDFFKAIHYVLLEYSEALIETQQQKVGLLLEGPEMSKKVSWVRGSAYEFPFKNIKGMVLSNELPDAFPIERITRLNGKIKQKYITIQEGKWVELLLDPTEEVEQYIQDYDIKIREGVEEPINLNAETFQDQVCKGLDVGGVLTIDYGWNKEVGTKGHLPVRLYSNLREDNNEEGYTRENLTNMYMYPSEIDITANINFKPLEKIGLENNFKSSFSGTQNDFLEQNGIKDLPNIVRNSSEIRKLNAFEDFYVQFLTKEE